MSRSRRSFMRRMLTATIRSMAVTRLIPATTPEQIDAALRAVSGRYELAGPQKRFRVIGASITGATICGIFVLGAWQSRWNPALIVFAVLAFFAAAYDLVKLHRVIEIG